MILNFKGNKHKNYIFEGISQKQLLKPFFSLCDRTRLRIKPSF